MKINREAKVFSNPVATTVFFIVLGVSGYLGYLVYPQTKPLIFVSLAGMALAFFLATASALPTNGRRRWSFEWVNIKD